MSGSGVATGSAASMIPAIYHYCWFGERFPYMNRIAIESALQRCAPARFVLWHEDALEQEAELQALRRNAALELRRLEPERLFANPQGISHDLDLDRLCDLYERVRSPVTRSNLVRAAALFFEGGIYLDLDTLVLQDLAPLRQLAAFVGSEHVVWPYAAKRGMSTYRLLKGPLLDLLRRVMRAHPEGVRMYRRLRSLYPTAVNAAVVGARPGHPFLAQLLRMSSEVPEAEWQRKHRLGTHVLQEAVAAYQGVPLGTPVDPRDALAVLPPAYFYPLGPEISRHYFHRKSDLEAAAAEILSPESYVVHWYASVSALSRIGPADLRRMASQNLLGHLCAPFAE